MARVLKFTSTIKIDITYNLFKKKFLFSNIYSIQYSIFERNFGRKERKKRKITE